jgi:hypothetical protein
MKTQIPTEWMNLELCHRLGGDGWGIVQILDDDYVHVAWPRASGYNADRACLAWVKMLTPVKRRQDVKNPESPMVIQPFSTEDMKKLELLRSHLLNGTKKVVNQRIVNA